MKKPFLLLAYALLFTISISTFTSCRDEKSTSEKVEETIDDAGDNIEEGVEEIEDEIDDATDDN